MAIEWPSIAQGSGTGTTYTSPDNFTWRWTGRAWEGQGGSFRGFPQPWAIFLSDGSVQSFPTLLQAILVALDGDTIHLYGDVTEAPGVSITKNIEINFNGHTLTFDYSLTSNPGDYGIYFSDIFAYKVKMYNGTVKYINESAYPALDRPLIRIFSTINEPGTYEFIGMSFITERNMAGYFIRTNVKGGNFYTTSGNYPAVAFDLTEGSTENNYTIEDVYAESEKTTGFGVSFINASIYSTYTFKNIVGVTKGNNLTLSTNSGINIYYLGTSIGPGHVNLIDCIGINNTPYIYDTNAGILINGGSGNPKSVIRVSNCFGTSVGSIGMIATNCELTNCVADGSRYNFILSNVNASGCADIRNEYDFTDESSGGSLVSQAGDIVIDNCAFSSGLASSDSTSGTSLLYKLDIRNSTIYKPTGVPLFLGPATATKVKINNNVIGYPGLTTNPINVSGGTGSEATNNVLFGVSGTLSSNTAIAGSATPMYLRSNIVFGANQTTHTIQAGSNATNQGNIVHP